MKNRLIVFILLLFLFAPLLSDAFVGEVIGNFSSPGKFPTGICSDGKNLWVADRKDKKIYCIDIASGKQIKNIPSPAYWSMGLTWDGSALWCSDIKGGLPLSENYSGIVYRISPDDGAILKSLRVFVKMIKGIAWDGKYLWCIDKGINRIVQLNPEDGTEIRTIPAPSPDASGLAFDGKYLWCSDKALKEIYMINPVDGSVIIIADAPGPYSNALCHDGKYLWVSDYHDKIIYRIVAADDTKFRKFNEQKATLTYNHMVTNFGPGSIKSLDVFFAVPSERENQIMNAPVKYSPAYTDIVTDKWGQKAAHFSINNMMPGKTNNIEMTVPVTTYDLQYYIYPEKVGSLGEIPDDIKKLYLVDDEKYQVNHPVIQKALKEALGDEKNPYWITRKIFNYVISHLFYEMTGGWNTAPTVLARGNGSCSEYSFVYISLCRAAGIPARYVGSVHRSAEVHYDDSFHRWIEIYLPKYGWIPVDPTIGDSSNPRDQAHAFGFVGYNFFITTQSGGGSEFLGWSYNSNERYSTEPKTFVSVDFWADWQKSE